MSWFILRRLLIMIPQLLGVVIITFFLVRVIPGNPAIQQLGANATGSSVEKLTEELGLNKPILVQFTDFVAGALTGDFGKSWRTGRNVVDEIANRLPTSIEIILLAFSVTVLVGVLGGIFLARSSVKKSGKANSVARSATHVYALVAAAIPEFWLGVVLLLIFYHALGVAPAPIGLLSPATSLDQVTGMVLVDSLIAGNFAAFWDGLSHLVLPVATLAIVAIAPLMRMTASEMRIGLTSEYSRYSRAVGLREGRVVRNALRSSCGPIIMLASVQAANMIGGVVVVEKTFAIGGFGQWGISSVLGSDYPSVVAFVTVGGVLVFAIYLLADVFHAAIDSRVR